MGSSPLARGLRRRIVERGIALRIIPARAGFTQLWFLAAVDRRDHPRSRGVYTSSGRSPSSSSGSSPLARGLLLRGHFLGTSNRIIPARAGFTLRMKRQLGPESDHPRSRGVYDVHSWA